MELRNFNGKQKEVAFYSKILRAFYTADANHYFKYIKL